jgi:hypothetical protein
MDELITFSGVSMRDCFNLLFVLIPVCKRHATGSWDGWRDDASMMDAGQATLSVASLNYIWSSKPKVAMFRALDLRMRFICIYYCCCFNCHLSIVFLSLALLIAHKL